jgi:hypothetical protein
MLSLLQENDYFNYRVKFGGKKFSSPRPLIGKEKSIEIITNVFIPYLLYLSRYKINKEFTKQHELSLFKLYTLLPVVNMNKIAKMMANRLFGPERLKNIFIKKERFQQGLIQLWLDFCDVKMNCQKCPLPSLLESYLDEFS